MANNRTKISKETLERIRNRITELTPKVKAEFSMAEALSELETELDGALEIGCDFAAIFDVYKEESKQDVSLTTFTSAIRRLKKNHKQTEKIISPVADPAKAKRTKKTAAGLSAPTAQSEPVAVSDTTDPSEPVPPVEYEITLEQYISDMENDVARAKEQADGASR